MCELKFFFFFSLVCQDYDSCSFVTCFMYGVLRSKLADDSSSCFQSTAIDLIETAKPGADDNDRVTETKLCPY